MSETERPYLIERQKQHTNLGIGAAISTLRQARRLTPIQLANAVNVTSPTIKNWESGYHNIPAHKLMDIANYFRVPIEFFYRQNTEYMAMLALDELESFFRQAFLCGWVAEYLLLVSRMEEVYTRWKEHDLPVPVDYERE